MFILLCKNFLLQISRYLYHKEYCPLLNYLQLIPSSGLYTTCNNTEYCGQYSPSTREILIFHHLGSAKGNFSSLFIQITKSILCHLLQLLIYLISKNLIYLIDYRLWAPCKRNPQTRIWYWVCVQTLRILLFKRYCKTSGHYNASV